MPVSVQGGLTLRIDGEPMVILPGEVPAWRDLRRNSEGADVAQLEAWWAARHPQVQAQVDAH